MLHKKIYLYITNIRKQIEINIRLICNKLILQELKLLRPSPKPNQL